MACVIRVATKTLVAFVRYHLAGLSSHSDFPSLTPFWNWNWQIQWQWQRRQDTCGFCRRCRRCLSFRFIDLPLLTPFHTWCSHWKDRKPKSHLFKIRKILYKGKQSPGELSFHQFQVQPNPLCRVQYLHKNQTFKYAESSLSFADPMKESCVTARLVLCCQVYSWACAVLCLWCWACWACAVRSIVELNSWQNSCDNWVAENAQRGTTRIHKDKQETKR